MKTSTKVRGLALLTGGVLAVSSLTAPGVQARTSRKDYKTGAVVLGALGVILATKGETVPAVVAGAGAYYAYKKSQDRRHNHNYANRYPTSRSHYSYNDRNNNQNVYPDAGDSENYDSGYNSLNATSKAKHSSSSVVID